jgi:hypothetical protein
VGATLARPYHRYGWGIPTAARVVIAPAMVVITPAVVVITPAMVAITPMTMPRLTPPPMRRRLVAPFSKTNVYDVAFTWSELCLT